MFLNFRYNPLGRYQNEFVAYLALYLIEIFANCIFNVRDVR